MVKRLLLIKFSKINFVRNIMSSPVKKHATKSDLSVKKSLSLVCLNHDCANKDESIWVFGYGSLVWKADFPYKCKHKGYIKGFERKFYQNSVDHRGTIDQPGRVVTLIHSKNPESRVYGMGYQISSLDKKQVLIHLDDREINGYDRLTVQFHLIDENNKQVLGTKDVIVYVATKDNPSFAGETDTMDTIADQICVCAGKSGKNTDYVLNLADSMRQLYPDVDDPHLFELEKIIKRRINLTLNGIK